MLCCAVKFKIDFDIPKNILPSTWPSFFAMGSCFADTQAESLAKSGFKVYSNPFGIIYNPISIATILYRLVNDKKYTNDDFIERGLYFSLEHHGSKKYENINEAVAKSNFFLEEAKYILEQCSVVVLTFGTSVVYHHIQTKKIAANNHKLPTKEFEILPLKYSSTLNSISNCIKAVREVNDKAQIICTVSPIRHLRTGVIENARSKAFLLTALHEAMEQNTNISYFPSFEIFMDELRDYRFAKEDMMHPTKIAQDYIFQRFKETYFNVNTLNIIDQVDQWQKFANHRPLASVDDHNELVDEKKKALATKYPFLHL